MKKRLHIIGIGGSAMSAVAILAHHQGFEVSGCDQTDATPYIDKVKKLGIQTFVGHDASHVKDSDIVAVTPATFFQNNQHPEVEYARDKKLLLTGREFEAKYLHKDKRLICIAGTHGKSTTTAMASLAFEKANLDPSVMIGATVKEWQSNCRVGKSDLFIVESDEFFDNFLSYKPETIILNNIEFDHPDYFKDEKQMYDSFKKHVESLKGDKNLIINQDSEGIKRLLSIIDHKILDQINLYGYTTQEKPLIEVFNSTKALNIELGKESTEFDARNDGLKIKNHFTLTVPGIYNVSNALGVITLAALYNVTQKSVAESLKKFSGIGRRLELICKKRGILIYDDYAHHPTAIKQTLKAVRQRHQLNRVWVIVEPHTYSRTKALLDLYEGAFKEANKVIIAPIYRSRDTKDFGMSGQTIVDKAKHNDISYINSFDEITQKINKEARGGDVVVVMGAGNSYKLSRQLEEVLTNDSAVNPSADILAKKIWNYMHLGQELKSADCILVLGGSSTSVIKRAVELYKHGYAKRVIISGSKGKYSQHLKISEAQVFADIAVTLGIPKENLILETKATNTSENISFTKELLAKKGIAINTIIAVQKPYTERRVFATFKKVWPDVEVVIASPKHSYEEEAHSYGFGFHSDFISTLVAQLERIVIYAKKGFIVSQQVPADVIKAGNKLKDMGFTKFLADIK